MGRIKTQLIKRTTTDLHVEHGDKFTDSFAENKALVDQHLDVPSKKIRNVIAGYMTRLKRQE